MKINHDTARPVAIPGYRPKDGIDVPPPEGHAATHETEPVAARSSSAAVRPALCAWLLGVTIALVVVAATVVSVIEIKRDAPSTPERTAPTLTTPMSHPAAARPADVPSPMATPVDVQPPAAKPADEPPKTSSAQREPSQERPAQPRKPMHGPASAPSAGQARTAAASPELGELDELTIRRYIGRHHAAIRHCYEQRLTRPALAGTIKTRFVIVPDGRVASLTVDGLDDQVGSCVAGILQNIQFPASGSAVHVSYPFHFHPSDRSPAL